MPDLPLRCLLRSPSWSRAPRPTCRGSRPSGLPEDRSGARHPASRPSCHPGRSSPSCRATPQPHLARSASHCPCLPAKATVCIAHAREVALGCNPRVGRTARNNARSEVTSPDRATQHSFLPFRSRGTCDAAHLGLLELDPLRRVAAIPHLGEAPCGATQVLGFV